ncbi:MAG: hypothetical protein ICV78_28860, partial [Tolypothrix sp. Co-bin9]|nr:hypothetical protein [Tolypothrix sp. Co-bin9]
GTDFRLCRDATPVATTGGTLRSSDAFGNASRTEEASAQTSLRNALAQISRLYARILGLTERY